MWSLSCRSMLARNWSTDTARVSQTSQRKIKKIWKNSIFDLKRSFDWDVLLWCCWSTFIYGMRAEGNRLTFDYLLILLIYFRTARDESAFEGGDTKTLQKRSVEKVMIGKREETEMRVFSIFHIDIKSRVYNIHQLDGQLLQLGKQRLKKSRLVRDSNLWPLWYRFSTLPMELRRQLGAGYLAGYRVND